jgi:hypothetical protein
VFARANLAQHHDHVFFSNTLASAIELAKELATHDGGGERGPAPTPGIAMTAPTVRH